MSACLHVWPLCTYFLYSVIVNPSCESKHDRKAFEADVLPQVFALSSP